MAISIIRTLILPAAVLTLAACGPSGEQRSKDAASDAAAASNPQASVTVNPPTTPPSAQEFVARAAASDLFEVQAGQLAQTRAADPQVKAFAAMMVRDHTKASQDLKKAIAEAGQSLTGGAALGPDQQKALNDLTSAAPQDFDRIYVQSQAKAHADAMGLLQSYAEQGDVASLKAFASQGAGVVQQHYAQARQLSEQLAR